MRGTAEVPVIGDRSARCGKTPVEIFREVAPSVVQIFAFGINPYTIIGRVESKTGSGVFLGDDLVATNFHVVLDASAIAVSTGDTIFEAELIGRDPMFDISILRVPGLSTHIEPIALAPSDELAIGQPAYVIGYPLAIGKSISSGIVLSRSISRSATSSVVGSAQCKSSYSITLGCFLAVASVRSTSVRSVSSLNL